MASKREITISLAVRFDIDKRTEAALVALGWTPPEDDDDPAEGRQADLVKEVWG